uniref:Putative ribonuclease H-like domain-containing protein n=1 Tax=Tanacetum cinerariifolium TaxID=118510 RepID=A0A699JHE7_TANCI|nr:putative ribonuclease H-like domain-containing protein [Tanacetum cinerariifolium]
MGKQEEKRVTGSFSFWLGFKVLKCVLRYLKGQPKLGLWYPRDCPFDLEAYSDSDYATANLDKKSTIRGCQFLGRRLISWQCKKQTIVATSTTKAEYVAPANCCGQMSNHGDKLVSAAGFSLHRWMKLCTTSTKADAAKLS